MLVWLTRFYSSFNASLTECHKHFHLVWENNRAMSAKQRRSCEDVYTVHGNGKVCLCLLSKNPLKLNKSKMNQIMLIMLCRNRDNKSLHQLSSENQYNYVVQAVLRYFSHCK